MPTVTSEKRKAANRLNGSRGGVKTAHGKSIVRHNARRHGILAELRTKYEGNAYDGYLRRLCDEYEPQGFMESLLVEPFLAVHSIVFLNGFDEVFLQF